ncbi:hypothetical protein [Actinophytocola sp.]|uniref:hypothetical protein n=1 Tax=Actinophytocola sp. TaxID=1872138 RepID=UPI003D6A62DD
MPAGVGNDVAKEIHWAAIKVRGTGTVLSSHRVDHTPQTITELIPNRSEGKAHHQAVLALARRRVNVLHALLRTRRPFEPGHSVNAA